MTQQTTLDSLIQRIDSAKRNEPDSLPRDLFSFLDSGQARPQQDSTSQADIWGVVIAVVFLVIAAWRDLRERKRKKSNQLADRLQLADRVRAWHAGQLATAWVAVLFVDVVLRSLFAYNVDRGYDDNIFAAGLCVIVGFSLTAAMLWASWTWFGSRERKS